MQNLAHSASFESLDKDAPSKAETKHLGFQRRSRVNILTFNSLAWRHLLTPDLSNTTKRLIFMSDPFARITIIFSNLETIREIAYIVLP